MKKRKLTQDERQALAGVQVARALVRLHADPDVAAEVHYPENWPGGVVDYLSRSAFDRAWEESGDADASPFTITQARRAARMVKAEAETFCAKAARAQEALERKTK
jgi:hypothetical protein